MIEVPKVEEMPWLFGETQADVDEMYRIYEKENKLMVPYDDLRDGERYTLIYVPDSGCSNYVLNIFREMLGDFKYRDVLQAEVKIIDKSPGIFGCGVCCFLRFIQNTYSDDENDVVISCAADNYGKSWRLVK